MNTKMIKKFKQEFDNFIKNGKESIIACEKQYLSRDGWDVDAQYLFESCSLDPERYLIIINDEFVKFRKALAQGKIIQYRNIKFDEFKEWQDLEKLSFNHNFEHRVKPEPFLEVGDWFNAAAKIHQVKEIIEGKTRTYKSDNGCLYDRFISKWNPEPGEYCFFHNGNKDSLVFGQYTRMKNGLFLARQLCKDLLVRSEDTKLFKYCEPLRGKIPQILKEE